MPSINEIKKIADDLIKKGQSDITEVSWEVETAGQATNSMQIFHRLRKRDGGVYDSLIMTKQGSKLTMSIKTKIVLEFK